MDVERNLSPVLETHPLPSELSHIMRRLYFGENSTLPFPAEIRELILANLLHSTEPRHEVSFDVKFWWKYKTKSEVLPVIYPEQIGNHFLRLCGVSKQTRADAIKVLFSRNRIHLGLERRLKKRSPWCEAEYSFVNMPKFIVEVLGKEALLSIRDLRISLHNDHQDSHDYVSGVL